MLASNLKRAQAFTRQLVRAHQGPLYSFLVRLSGRRDLAEDITQEAFVRAIQHLHRFDFEHRFSTWLFTIARRVYWNVSEKHAPVPVGDALEGLHEFDLAKHGAWARAAAEVSQGLELQEERTRSGKVLQAALLELPPVQREIVVLFHQQGWSIALLSSALSMPEGTVKSHLHRARVRLRELVMFTGGDTAEGLGSNDNGNASGSGQAQQAGNDKRVDEGHSAMLQDQELPNQRNTGDTFVQRQEDGALARVHPASNQEENGELRDAAKGKTRPKDNRGRAQQ
jgi:RNA polymerase sigma-70 factor (ECF subfamily)